MPQDEPAPSEPGGAAAPAPRGLAQPRGDMAVELGPKLERLVFLRGLKASQEAELTETNKEISNLSHELAERFDQYGLRNMKVDKLGTFYRATVKSPKVMDEEALFEDLRKHDLGALIKPTVPWQTLRSVVTERADAGLPELRGIEVYEEQVVRHRKA